ncbi:hypothetical protein [Couchioplanes caeruleus]|uniref:Uncharacterized protein n=1 Tax=Couchioplanes caeruleus TaxID=56438 RepID=A0A3N1GT52_9ACTN|nr:hypothetical protein [Couchioplanes caeruleus]ROP33417.1 hypothetical protein EDD30_6396 [Couchioplanes caeruleus]
MGHQPVAERGRSAVADVRRARAEHRLTVAHLDRWLLPGLDFHDEGSGENGACFT